MKESPIDPVPWWRQANVIKSDTQEKPTQELSGQLFEDEDDMVPTCPSCNVLVTQCGPDCPQGLKK